MKKQSKIYKTVNSLLTSANNRTDLDVCSGGIHYAIRSNCSTNGHETVKMQEVTMSTPWTNDIVINGNLLITDCDYNLGKVFTAQIQTEKIIYFFKGLPYPVQTPEWLYKTKVCYISIVDNFVDKVIRYKKDNFDGRDDNFVNVARFDSGWFYPNRDIHFTDMVKCVPCGITEETPEGAPEFLEYESLTRFVGTCENGGKKFIIAQGFWQEKTGNRFLYVSKEYHESNGNNTRSIMPDDYQECYITSPIEGKRVPTCCPHNDDWVQISDNEVIGAFRESPDAECTYN